MSLRFIILLFGILFLFNTEGVAQLETHIDKWKEKAEIINYNAFLIDGEKFDYKVTINFMASIDPKKNIYGWSTSWTLDIVSDYWFRNPTDDIEGVWFKTKNEEAFRIDESNKWKVLKGDDYLWIAHMPFNIMQKIKKYSYFEIRFYYTDGSKFTWQSTKKAINEINKIFDEAIKVQDNFK